ncbi:MAG: DUF1674 domain-containing protein [Emcibacteraceae bacterium]|nr:DUF1674 domain-containing protein [Emcibacteraceae bacterium]
MQKEKKAAPKTTEQQEKSPKIDEKAKEHGGRDGPDPVRYGDWENNGIASDF